MNKYYSYEQNCPRCKKEHNINVPLRAIHIEKVNHNSKVGIRLEYVCSCGYSFDKKIYRDGISPL